ncbi:hypothetical protein [Lysobacter arvi]|uniref:Uncharacterized protein n=1 Tax=Lysobacter arvi TaxID=3038776 RepID=A0ABU1CGA2_9GAMM|nr:hypothetical protein [Lysobacter arvi]MDR0183970.1 hypothetical protein [Lysobacter arvi]
MTLWYASQWWERSFGSRLSSAVTEDGCYRLERYSPYWLLPHWFHPYRQPFEAWNPLRDWSGPMNPHEAPGFYRLYDNRSGKLLVETEVYDLAFVGTGQALWASEWYAKAGGRIDARSASDMGLPCSQ